MKAIDIAAVCHEANRQFCAEHHDFSQPAWTDAPDWQRDSAVDGVLFCLANPFAHDSACHDNWCMTKMNDGWVYGEAKDPEKKTHPCLVPFEALPPMQKAKDRLFAGIVRALYPLWEGNQQ
jgi:hypothetical protein